MLVNLIALTPCTVIYTAPAAVSNLTAVPLSAHSMAISWSEPLEPNGAYLQYNYSVGEVTNGMTVVADTTQSHIVRVEELSKLLLWQPP